MGWQLSPGVSFCRAGDDFIFLDLRFDRYFQLAGHDQRIFERLQRREAADAELERFVAADIVRRTESQVTLASVQCELAADDLYALEPSRASIAGALETALHVARARGAIRSDRLAATIANLSRRKAEVARRDDTAVLAIALRFDANRPLIPVARRCLVDSVALMCMLLRRGCAADLVFGVRTGPFAAHCWLQAGGHILTCAHDEARNFTPILVI